MSDQTSNLPSAPDGSILPGPGGPKGRRNRAKGTEWRDMLMWALENYENQSGVARGQALRAIAMQLVADAFDPNPAIRREAIEEIANRLDGKPAVSVQVSTVRDEPLEITHTVIEGTFIPSPVVTPAVREAGED